MVYYATAAGAVIMNGPTGIMIPLGIENFMPLATAYMLYNYIALGILFFIAAMAGARNEARFAVVIPIFAGIFTWVGWLHAPNPAQTWAVMIICGLLGVAMYMNEQNRERYGIGGPGSKLLNLVFFIILFEACIGLIQGFNLFPVGNTQPTPNSCTVGMSCDAYGNIQLSQSVTSIQSTGGLFQDVVSAVAALPAIAFSILKFIIQIVGAVLLFSVVVNSTMNGIFPGIAENGMYLAFLVVMQVVIWAIYGLTFFNWYYKPFPSEGAL
jgi:hypothetical protein